MAYLNKVLLIGNLTRDPELRQTPGGQSVCKIGLATNRRFKSQSGEMREDTTYLDVTVWGQRGDALAKYLKKGEPVFIEGRLTYEEWQDKNSGQKRSKISVTAEDWQFVGGRADGSRGSSAGAQSARSAESAPPTTYPQAAGGNAAGGNEDEASLDAGGGVPF